MPLGWKTEVTATDASTSTSKHPRAGLDPRDPELPHPPDDLRRNPGIGSSKGDFAASKVDPEEIDGENTFEGDVLSDTDPAGGLDPEQRGRTNK